MPGSATVATQAKAVQTEKIMEGKNRGGGLGFGGFVVKTGSGLVAKGWEKEGRQGRG